MKRVHFSELLKKDEFIFTSEVGPPKGVNLDKFRSKVKLLINTGKIGAINVTDNQSAVARLCSLVACRVIQECGGEPILQVTCRDRNRLAIQADLFGAYAFGIRNVLCLTGDHPKIGDNPEAKPVYDLDPIQLIVALKNMEKAEDMAGNKLDSPLFWNIGAVFTPESNIPLELNLIRFKKKIDAGALFFQSQAVFEPASLLPFIEFLQKNNKNNVKILAGILVLSSYPMAKYVKENVPGIVIPDRYLEELHKAGKERVVEVGIEIAVNIIRKIKKEKLASGVHIMAIGREEIVPKILENVVNT